MMWPRRCAAVGAEVDRGVSGGGAVIAVVVAGSASAVTGDVGEVGSRFDGNGGGGLGR